MTASARFLPGQIANFASVAIDPIAAIVVGTAMSHQVPIDFASSESMGIVVRLTVGGSLSPRHFHRADHLGEEVIRGAPSTSASGVRMTRCRRAGRATSWTSSGTA